MRIISVYRLIIIFAALSFQINPAHAGYNYQKIWESQGIGDISSVTAGDPDNDLKKEIIAASKKNNRVYLFENTGNNTWEKVWDSGNSITNQVFSIATGDLDGDNKKEIIAGSRAGIYEGKIYVFENIGDNSYQPVWNSGTTTVSDGTISNYSILSVAIGDDLDGDNKKELLAGSMEKIYVFEKNTDNDYQLVATKTVGYVSQVSSDDIDSDGKKEIFAAVDNKIHVFKNTADNTYDEVWNSGDIIEGHIYSVCSGDTDGDTRKEIISAGEDNKIYIFENTGSNTCQSVWNSGNAVTNIISSVIVADLNDDSRQEIIAGSYDHKIYIFENTGDNTYQKVWDSGTAISSGITSICSGDLDNDSRQEIIAASSEKIFVFKSSELSDYSISVIINPASSTVDVFGSRSFTAQANQPDATYTWTLKTAGMGTLDTANGQTVVFTAARTGTVNLQVTVGFGTRTAMATASVTIVNGAVHHVNITPATATVEARGTASFTARAYNQYGYELTGAVNFGWQIVQGSGTIDTPLTPLIRGEYTPLAPLVRGEYMPRGENTSRGKYTPLPLLLEGNMVVIETNDVVGTLILTASAGTVTGTATVAIIHGSVSAVSITPATATVEVMGSRTFTSGAVNRFGHPIPASELSYDWGLSGSGTIAASSDTAVFTAGSRTGRAGIRLEAVGRQATATITITPGAIKQMVFTQVPGTLTASMPGTMTIQMQDEYGNASPATASTTVIVRGDGQSRFAGASSGAAWTTSGTFTITGTSSLTFFCKQNGTAASAIITAAIGASISATHTITIEALNSSSFGIVVADDGRTTVEIDPGAISGAGGYIEIDTSGTSIADTVVAANGHDDTDTRIDRIEGTLRRFEIRNATITTAAKVRIAIPYPDVDNDGYVDGTGIWEGSLWIYTAVGTGTDARWQVVEDSRVDDTNNVVYAFVPHFSYYILMGSVFESTPEKVSVCPNPYEAGKHTLIYFDRLSENSTIKVYNIAGELVWEKLVQSPREAWDARNSAGERVASGIYTCIIKDQAGNRKTGKLAIIR